MKAGFGIIVLTAALASSGLAAEGDGLVPYGMEPQQQKTLKTLWEAALKYSGRTSVRGPDGYKEIPVYKVTPAQMIANACPSDPAQCRNALGAFLHVSRRMFVTGDLDPEKSVGDASVMVHEYVHALQNETASPDDIMKNCEMAEQEAIDAQNRYLESMKSTMRMYSGHTCR